ncbi:MAG TPA: alpha/beta fold hydrolase [Chroococcidiopsis sp.]
MENTLMNSQHYPVLIHTGSVRLEGDLIIPARAQGIVLFAHGSGSSRYSPRNRAVAKILRHEGLATLLVDLLTAEEEDIDRRTRQLRFDINLLATRLIGITDWLQRTQATRQLNIGYFGASTGSAAALMAAARHPDSVKAVVSRGGRPDLVGSVLERVKAPTLLIVGGYDLPVLTLNHDAFPLLRQTSAKQLAVIPGATHLFEEPGALEEVATMASQWFTRYLVAP